MKTITQQRILVVDDNVANRELLEALLLSNGYDVALSESGEQCLQYIARNQVDLVMLDVMMPGMDGFEVATRIRSDERTETLPIIMITALEDKRNRIAGIEAGCDDFISKPFDGDEVLARTRALFRMTEVRNRRSVETAETVEAIRHQLEDARRIQEALYPKAIPSVAGFDTWGTSLSSLEMSGDYYDVILANGGRAFFVVADVCGKGIPAALLAANIHAGIHGQLLQDGPDLVEMVNNLNRIVADNTPDGVFATMILGEFIEGGVVRYVRAGHELPCIVRADGSVHRPESGGGLLGIDPDMRYEMAELALFPGDLLCAYTDGVTDAENEAGNAFGDSRLEKLLSGNRAESSERIGAAVVDAVNRFAHERIDDMTLVVTRNIR